MKDRLCICENLDGEDEQCAQVLEVRRNVEVVKVGALDMEASERNIKEVNASKTLIPEASTKNPMTKTYIRRRTKKHTRQIKPTKPTM